MPTISILWALIIESFSREQRVYEIRYEQDQIQEEADRGTRQYARMTEFQLMLSII